MGLTAFQLASLEGPGSKKPTPAPSPGLTGADLVEAKAQAEADASSKGLMTADVQHPMRDSRTAEYAESSQKYRDLRHIIEERKPVAPAPPNPIMQRLMAYLSTHPDP